MVVADDGDVVAGSTAERTTVANLLLDVGDDGTLGNGREGKDVSDGESGVLAGVDELASVHALVGDESLGVQLVAVGVAELNAGEGSTTTGVVDDILHDTADVTMALGEVEGAELSSANPCAVGGLEDATSTFTLISDLEGRSSVVSFDVTITTISSSELPPSIARMCRPRLTVENNTVAGKTTQPR